MAVDHIWYKDGAVVVAIIALVFSVTGSLFAWWNKRLQERQANHLDLTTVLQRLLAVPREHFEFTLKYPGNTKADGISASVLQQELNMLALQGAAVARQLGPKVVTSPEYLIIGNAQLDACDYAAHREFILMARENAGTPKAVYMARIAYASILFADGKKAKEEHKLAAAGAKFAEGRQEFSVAEASLARYPPLTPGSEVLQAVLDNFQLQQQWAMAEVVMTEDISAALERLKSLRAIVAALPSSAQRDAIAQQAALSTVVAAKSLSMKDQSAEVRELFQAALNLFTVGYNPAVVASSCVAIQMDWATAEATVAGNKLVADAHRAAAKAIVESFPAGDIRDALEKQMAG